MYRELLSEGAYDNATEYAQLLAFAKIKFEEEVAKEEYKREYFNQIEPQEIKDICTTRLWLSQPSVRSFDLEREIR